MFTNKGLKLLQDEVKQLDGRLVTLENNGLDNEIVSLQKQVQELALKLSNLKGKATLIGLVFGALTALLNIIALYNINEYQEFAAAKVRIYNILLEVYQDEIADTIDRISLNDPSNEDKARVEKLNSMRKTFSELEGKNDKFDKLSHLITALELIVIQNKEKEASALLDKEHLPTSTDPFIAARAFTLKAMALVLPSRQCSWPEGTKPLVDDAMRLDSGVAAAFNILGVCLTEEAKRSIEKPGEWEKGNQIMQDALMNYHLAYDIKPATGTKLKLLNNKVWADSLFLYAALSHKKLNEGLPQTGYESIEKFFAGSLKDLGVCQRLSQSQAVYWETEAQLHGLKYVYYKDHVPNEKEALEALDKMRIQFEQAINKDLYKRWKGNPTGAIEDLRTDNLLKPLWDDESILKLIKERVSSR